MKNIIKKSAIALMLLFTFCMFTSFEAKAAGSYTQASVTEISDTSATINWVYMGSERYTHIYLSVDNVNFFKKDWSTSSSEWFSGLAPNTTYFVKLREATGSGESAGTEVWSNVFSFTTLPSTPSKPTTVSEVGATANSITVAWDAVIGATGYEVSVYMNGIYTPMAVTNATTATVPNLLPNTTYSICVRSMATNASGTVYSDYTSRWNDYKTVPATVAASSLYVSSLYNWSNSITFAWSGVNADGYDFQVYNNKNKRVVNGVTAYSSYSTSLKKGVFYKYRVRPYVNLSNGQRAYGAWSGYRYHGVSKSLSGKTYSKSRKIRASWKKVAGATGYTVYISRTSSTSGYRKVKSLSKKKNSITITKFGKSRLKRGETYYVKVVTKGKSGKNKGTSSTYNWASAYIYR